MNIDVINVKQLLINLLYIYMCTFTCTYVQHIINHSCLLVDLKNQYLWRLGDFYTCVYIKRVEFSSVLVTLVILLQEIKSW